MAGFLNLQFGFKIGYLQPLELSLPFNYMQPHMIADRINNIAPSQTMKISARAKELQQEGRSVVTLSQGEPDFKTPDYICEAAIDAIRQGHHGYTVNPGNIELRKLICKKLKDENGLDYTPKQIVVSNGAKQSIGFSILATINPGDEVIIPAPYWVSYPEMVKIAGGKPIIVRTSVDREYKITPEELREALSPHTRMVIICSPSNPTGSCYTKNELNELAKVLLEYPDVLVMSDEIYEYLTYEAGHTGIAEVSEELKQRTILINGFSKGFAMTGWRLGYLAAPEEIAAATAKFQSQETSGASSISQKAGEAAYSNPRDEITTMKKAFKKRRDFIVGELSAIQGVSCFSPAGAFYVFPDVSAYLNLKTPGGKTVATSTDLCLYLLEDHGVALVPGDAFGEPNGLRISFAASDEMLRDGISRIKQGLAALS